MTRHAVVIAALAAATALGAAALASAGGSSSTAAVTCSESAKLKLPNGKPLRLSGIWKEGGGDIYYIRQAGSCVWALRQSRAIPGLPQGVAGTSVVYAHVRPNLQFTGQWSDLPRQSGSMGQGSTAGVIRLNGNSLVMDFTGDLVITMKQPCATNIIC